MRPPCDGLRRDTEHRGDACRPEGHRGTAAREPWPQGSDEPSEEYSYTPLDCGFDLRRHPELSIELPQGDWMRVRYLDGCDERVVDGTRAHVAETLTAAGYRVES